MKKLFTLLIAFTLFTSTKAQFVNLPDTNFRNWFLANGFSSCIVGNTLDTSCVALNVVTVLNINSDSIFNYYGLQYFKQLRWLQLSYIADTSINNCLPATLTKLSIIQPANVFSLYNSILPNLDTLEIYGSNNQNLLPSILPSTLTYFSCVSCNVSGLPTFSNGLLFVNFSFCNITSFPILPNSVTSIICDNTKLSNIVSLPSSLISFHSNNSIRLKYLPTSFPATLKILVCENDSLLSISTLPDTMYYVNLDNNKINSISHLPLQLSSLYLYNNNLSTLPNMPNVIVLKLQNNNISYLPYSVSSQFPNSLNIIDLSYNKFNHYNFDFSNTNLEEINISHGNKNNNLGVYGVHLPGYIKLLNASNNFISSNSIIIDSFKILNGPYYTFKGIDLSFNQLTDLDFLDNWRNYELYDYASSTVVNFSHNQLTNPGNWAFRMPDNYLANSIANYSTSWPYGPIIRGFHFNNLDLSYNNITGFLTNWLNVTETLNISHNQINDFRANLYYYYPIPYDNFFGSFNCSYNLLDSIPYYFGFNDLIADHNNLQYLNAINPSQSLILNHNLNLGCLPVLNSLTNLNFDSTAITCVSNYGTVLNSIPNLSTIPLCNTLNNVHGCPIYSNISGKLYTDINNDCYYNSSTDGNLSYKGVSIYSGSTLIKKIFSNINGDFNLVVNPGNYYLKADTVGMPYKVTCPASDSIAVTATLANPIYNRNFGFVCKPSFDIGIWSIMGNKEFFPGENTTISNTVGDFAKIKGLACNTSNVGGQVKLVFSGPVSYIGVGNSAIAPSIIKTDTLIWNVVDFSLLNSNAFDVVLHTFASAQSGNQVCLKEWVILNTNGDLDTSNNYFTSCYSIVNSFDPNNKEVTPSGALPAPYIGYLTYTIHFQNTGTAPAHNIELLDTMPTALDPATFILLGSSHNVTASVSTINNIATFDFNNIYLVDSFHNEVQSHGWIQYKIKLKNGLPIGLKVKNRASIYFDFNPPVLTNYASNRICTSSVLNSIHKSICNGSSYIFNGVPYSVAGHYNFKTQTYLGCDSIVDLFLTILPISISTSTHRDTICLNNPFYFNHFFYSKSGTYYDTLVNMVGCDSIVVLQLIVIPISNYSYNNTICSNQIYNFNNHNLNLAGIYFDTLQNYLGCDSFITLNLSVNPIRNTVLTKNICFGNSYLFNGNNLSTTGIYYDTLINYLGCDSFITLNLQVNQQRSFIFNQHICNNQRYNFNGRFLINNGIYFDTILTYKGCDSFITLNLIVLPTSNYSFNQIICSNNSYLFNHHNLNLAGIYYDTLQNYLGCDSFITMNLTVLPISNYSFNQTICNNHFYNFNSRNLNQTGIYFDTLQNYLGCDSFITLNLKVLPNGSVYSANICSNQNYFFNGNNISSAGFYYDTLQNYLGCDSFITFKLIVKPTSSYSFNHTICAKQFYYFNNQYLNQTGVYYDTIQNHNGCDSFITLQLLVNPISNYSFNKTMCSNEYFVFNNRQQYFTGTYLDTLQNYLGCDSFITLNLTVLPVSTTAIYKSGCENNPYFFNGKYISYSGKYFDTLVNYLGCDSTVTLHYTAWPSYHSGTVITICKGSVYSYHGHQYTNSVFLADTFITSLGCDSIISVQIIAIPTPDTSVIQLDNKLIATALHSGFQWVNCTTDNEIFGATNDTFIANKSGSYAVIVFDSTTYCRDTSNCRNILVSGIEEQIAKGGGQLVVYPNPCEAVISIQLSVGSINTIEVSNVLGQVCIIPPFQRGLGGVNINVAALPNGIYFIKATDINGNIMNGKFVKE